MLLKWISFRLDRIVFNTAERFKVTFGRHAWNQLSLLIPKYFLRVLWETNGCSRTINYSRTNPLENEGAH